jgi:glutamine synthetase
MWSFDGSSTNQAPGDKSDCVLRPVRLYDNPLEENCYLVLCEVFNTDETAHKTNHRFKLGLLDSIHSREEVWVGIEQEYTLYEDGRPLGWPEDGTDPPPQGDYYCGRNAGEEIMTAHTDLCLEAGIRICGTNAEVMLGQWEYQIGPGSSLQMSDDLWVARWLMERICEKHGVSVSLDPKPIEGDWNGAGCHTNFSTKQMREEGGNKPIFTACQDLEKAHKEHMAEYGEGNERRLTGEHETQAIDTFSWGVSDRGASIRIPWQVDKDKCGYLEDRRPSSNCDPYIVSQKLVETICK